jgi:hypothetical protein
MRNEGKAEKLLKRMAPQVGLEPTTLRLTVEKRHVLAMDAVASFPTQVTASIVVPSSAGQNLF